MSDHLPECECYGRNHGECALCICDWLRACEERVRESAATLWERTDEQMADARRQGYAAALDAAREAVASVGVRKDTSYDMRVQALADIDALRGSGNPGSPTPAEKGEQA